MATRTTARTRRRRWASQRRCQERRRCRQGSNLPPYHPVETPSLPPYHPVETRDLPPHHPVETPSLPPYRPVATLSLPPDAPVATLSLPPDPPVATRSLLTLPWRRALADRPCGRPSGRACVCGASSTMPMADRRAQSPFTRGAPLPIEDTGRSWVPCDRAMLMAVALCASSRCLPSGSRVLIWQTATARTPRRVR
jgi:hypothetical protein